MSAAVKTFDKFIPLLDAHRGLNHPEIFSVLWGQSHMSSLIFFSLSLSACLTLASESKLKWTALQTLFMTFDDNLMFPVIFKS